MLENLFSNKPVTILGITFPGFVWLGFLVVLALALGLIGSKRARRRIRRFRFRRFRRPRFRRFRFRRRRRR